MRVLESFGKVVTFRVSYIMGTLLKSVSLLFTYLVFVSSVESKHFDAVTLNIHIIITCGTGVTRAELYTSRYANFPEMCWSWSRLALS